MNKADIDNFIDQFKTLQINQQQHIAELVQHISRESSHNLHHKQTKTVGTQHNKVKGTTITTENVRESIKVGDIVRILNSRKTGKRGDTAKVIKINKKYITIQLEKNHSQTYRDPKYLELV